MIGLGFIGGGMVGQIAHLANFVELPGCRAIGLAELRPELGRQVAERFGITRIYPSHRELLCDPNIDAVVVVTRRPSTGPIVLDALRAGKHVLSEKPMAHTVAQAERLVAASAKAGVKYAIGFMKRHDAGVQHAKAALEDLIKSNELGRVILLRAYCFGGDFQLGNEEFVMTQEIRPEGLELWPVAPEWLPEPMWNDYAWFLNVFVHDLNLMRYLTGRMPQVTGVDLKRPNGRLAMFDFGDFPAVLEMGEVGFHEWQEGVDILFEKGQLRVKIPPPLLRDVPAKVELYYGASRNETARPVVAQSWAFRRQAEAFLEDIAFDREPIASGTDSLQDMVLVEQIWRKHLEQISAI